MCATSRYQYNLSLGTMVMTMYDAHHAAAFRAVPPRMDHCPAHCLSRNRCSDGNNDLHFEGADCIHVPGTQNVTPQAQAL